jgi:hypothetical protein
MTSNLPYHIRTTHETWLYIGFLLLVVTTGCSVYQSPEEKQCRAWQQEGDFFATAKSCETCVKTMGSGSKDAVGGCALGIDTANMLDSIR